LLKNALFYNFEIFSNIYCFNKTKEQYIISIPKKEVYKVTIKVYNYFIPSMLFKSGY